MVRVVENTMQTDWQSLAVYAVVAGTVVIMAYRLAFKKKAGCGNSCGCGSKLLQQDPKKNKDSQMPSGGITR